MPYHDEDFDLPDLTASPMAVEPLDIAPMAGQQPQQPAQPGRRNQFTQIAQIIPLLAAAGAKGGRMGIAAFLQGLQSAQARRQEEQRYQQREGRLNAQDARLARLDQGNADYRQQQLMLNAEQQRRAAEQARMTQATTARQNFATALNGLEDDTAIPELARFYAASGAVPQADLERFAMTTLPPSRLQKRAAETKIAKLQKDFGAQWLERGRQFTHIMPDSPIDPETGQKRGIPLDEILRRAEMTPDPNAPPPPPEKANTPEEQFYQRFAEENGARSFAELSTAKQQQARQAWMKSGRAGEEEGAAVPLSGSGLDMAAKMYALTGQLPPMGMGQAGAAVRARIINRAAQYDQNTGTFTATTAPNLAGNKANYQANTQALNQITKNLNAVEAFETTAEKNAALMDDVLKKMPGRTSITILNRPIRSLAGVLGNEDIATFNTLRLSLQNEYARLVSNPNLVGVLSDSARREMELVLRPDATVGQLRAALKTLKAEAANRREAFRAQRDQLRTEIQGQPTTNTAPPTTDAATSARDKLKNR